MNKALICLSLVILPLVSVVSGFGSWKPIKNVFDPSVVALAKYAIDEQNKQSTTKLVFVKILDGKEKLVSGKLYDLTIVAKNDGGAIKNYDAVVLEKLWIKYRKLESFKEL